MVYCPTKTVPLMPKNIMVVCYCVVCARGFCKFMPVVVLLSMVRDDDDDDDVVDNGVHLLYIYLLCFDQHVCAVNGL